MKVVTICNKCGKEFDLYDNLEGFRIFKDCLGYGTEFDGSKLELDLCCECMNELIKSCKVSPVEEPLEPIA